MTLINLIGSLLVAVGPAPAPAAAAQETAGGGEPARPAAATPALDAQQRELLDLAFEAASALPLMPHHKDRARAQLAVVQTCLELDQPELALEWAGAIRNWRRGEACGDVARWYAAHGRGGEARLCLEQAAAVLAGPSGGEDWQTWQRDRIRARIASTHMALGQMEEAREYAANLSEAELLPVAEQRAALSSEAEVDAFLDELDEAFARASFEQVRAALTTLVGLHQRFRGDEARRALVAARIRAVWVNMPVTVRLEVLEALAAAAVEDGDEQEALALLDEARPLATGANILPEARVPLRARLAVLRGRAGDAAGARREADETLAQFEAEREQILGTEQADTLRSLAEAYHALGNREGALAIFRRVVELGVVNPNSRPRAEDLSATCCSLARIGLQPDQELSERLREVRAALGPPW